MTVKMIAIRLEESLRNCAKSQAYKEGTTMQEWIIALIKKELEKTDYKNN